jgi:hypothetical protein
MEKNFNLWKFKIKMISMEFRICGRLLKASRSSIIMCGCKHEEGV